MFVCIPSYYGDFLNDINTLNTQYTENLSFAITQVANYVNEVKMRFDDHIQQTEEWRVYDRSIHGPYK